MMVIVNYAVKPSTENIKRVTLVNLILYDLNKYYILYSIYNVF